MKFILKYFQFILLLASCASSEPERILNRKIAFVKVDAGVNHIYVMEISKDGHGTNPSRITTDSESEDYPNWSPDGAMLAFTRGRDGSGIYVINADGTGLRRVSPTPGFDVTASWSPDGKQLIYSRVLDQIAPNVMPKTEIRIMNFDGSNDHMILPGTDFSVEPR